MENISHLLNKTSNKKLLVIMPHPDDETVMASVVMQQALAQGFEVKVIVVTNGVMGRIHIHGLGRSVVQIRKEELKNAMAILGVEDFVMWRFCDGLLQELESWKLEVEALIKTYDPGIVISYGPDGASGHPDHLALGKFVWQNWVNQESYQLIWPSFIGKTLDFFKEKTSTASRIVTASIFSQPSKVQIENKIKAIQSHLSQDLSTPLEWIDGDENEYFGLPEKGRDYDFSYVDFDLGI